MKILYTLGDFFNSGHQVLLYTINNENKAVEDYQKKAEYCLANSLKPKDQIFEGMASVDANPPAVGDVIWIQTSGNQYIAAGIWQESPNRLVSFHALKLILKSVYNKATELKQKYVSMPLLTINHDLELWNVIYPIIEESFDDSDIQVIVHIPEESELLQVLDSIGGEINAFESKLPIIRFI